jgi:hypothetical protein
MRCSPKFGLIGGDPELLDSYFLVAMDSSEAEEKLLDSRQTSDDVIRRASRQGESWD